MCELELFSELYAIRLRNCKIVNCTKFDPKKFRKLSSFQMHLCAIDCTQNEFLLAICKLTQLTQLSIDLCHVGGIPALPESFSNLSELEKFEYSGSNFSEIPIVLLNMKNLIYLKLPNCPIKKIDLKIMVTKIEVLHMREAKIEVPEMELLLAMKYLEVLIVPEDIRRIMESLSDYRLRLSNQLEIFGVEEESIDE